MAGSDWREFWIVFSFPYYTVRLVSSFILFNFILCYRMFGEIKLLS